MDEMRNAPELLFIGLVVSVCWASAAPAQTTDYTTATVTSGKPARLGYYATIKKDCSPGPLPEIRVVTAPKSGTLTVTRANLTTNKVANCPAATTPVQVVFYRSRPGFVGEDLIAYDVKESSGRVRSYAITITVRAPAQNQPKSDAERI
jgi:hypothetical protein